MYRSHLSDAEPDYDDALLFYRDRQLVPPQFDVWLTAQRKQDEKNYLAHGHTRGLLHHIRTVQGWHNDADDDENGLRLLESGRSHSSCEIGSTVDRELQLLMTEDVVVHRYTRWLVIYFCQRQWVPCAFQTPIWADGVRTYADIIVYDTRRARFLLIELKTGYDNNYDTVLRERSAYDYFTKTLRTMCHLQLGWMYFELDRAAHPWPLDACVLRVSSARGVRRPEPLMDAVLAYYRMEYAKAPLPHLLAPTEEEDDDVVIISVNKRVKKD